MKPLPFAASLNRTRRIGVEHEFSIPLVGTGTAAQVQRQIADILTANGLPACSRDYCHDPVERRYVFAVERDGSVEGESRYRGVTWVPVEIKTRILSGYDEWERYVPRMLALVAYLGGRATRSCGYHLHLDLPEFRDRPQVARSLYNLFHRFEPVIYRLLPPSRTHNRYCRPLPDRRGLLNDCTTPENFRQTLSGPTDRYNALNLTHLFTDSGPRVELRHAGGTLDPVKACHWLRFCLRMVDHACIRTCQASGPVEPSREGLNRLLISCGFKVNSKIYTSVSEELRKTARYLVLRRWRRFNGPDGCTAASESGADDLATTRAERRAV